MTIKTCPKEYVTRAELSARATPACDIEQEKLERVHGLGGKAYCFVPVKLYAQDSVIVVPANVMLNDVVALPVIEPSLLIVIVSVIWLVPASGVQLTL